MNVYLLGAGFSGDAGVPTMKNFLKGVHVAAENENLQSLHSVLQRAVLYAEAQNCDNMETLLTKALNEPVFFDLIWAFALTVSHYSLAFSTKCTDGKDLGWYETFVRNAVADSAALLSFNYDLVIEQILWQRLHGQEDYHLCFTEDYANTSTPKSPLSLYKLHGSVSWLWCLSCGATINQHEHLVFSAFMHTACPRCSKRLIPLIIPPTFRKALDHTNPLRSLWEQAEVLLTKAERIIIGGLSFADRDADFRNLFITCISRNTGLQEVVIINRDAATANKLGSLLPQHLSWRTVIGFQQYCQETSDTLSINTCRTKRK